MKDFVNWCNENKLIDIDGEGSVTWKEEAVNGAKCKKKEVIDGGRDIRKDLSSDYKDYCHHMGTVWPFKVLGGKGGKPVAPVGK